VGCDPKNYLFWSQLGTLLAILDDAAGARKAFTRARELRSWAPVPSAWEGSP
jgi:Flp pilus assembly protein TadD